MARFSALRWTYALPDRLFLLYSGKRRPLDVPLYPQAAGDAYAASRKALAAATILVSAGSTSAHWRVFRPQSGLTHRRDAGMRSAAFRISCSMCRCVGMLGEWMS